MLKKDKMIPGTQIKVRPVIKDGLPRAMFGDTNVPGSRDGIKDHIGLMRASGDFFGGGVGVRSGAVLTVVRGPKKKDGINCAMVQVPGYTEDFYAYWCELRASCDHV